MNQAGTDVLQRWVLLGMVCAVLLMNPVAGFSAEPGDRLLCADDITRYCKGLKPGEGRIINCLKEHEAELSADCRAKIDEVRNALSRIEKDCRADIEKHCKGVQPGGGRIAACLRENQEGLSGPCRETLGATRVLKPKAAKAE